MSAIYEREFKGILGGDAEVITSMSKTLPPADLTAYHSALASPFLVVRAAGSLGADLVALRHDVSFIVEVKSSKSSRIHFSDSPRLSEQVAIIRDQCERSGVLPLYAFRLKGVRGDPWRVYALPGTRLSGAAGELARLIPSVEKTAKGNDVLAWDNGMPLSRLLERLSRAPVRLPVVVASS